MRVLLYTKSFFLDEVLSAVPALGAACELHVVVEMPPESWGYNMVPSRPAHVRAGLFSLREVLGGEFPDAAWATLSSAATVTAAVFDEDHTLGPAAVISALSLANRIRSLAPDLVHLNGESLRFAYGTPLLGHIPVVLSVHDPVPHGGEEGGWRSRLALSRRVLLPRLSSVIVHNSRTMTGPMLAAARARGIPIRFVRMGPYSIYRAFGADRPGAEARDVLFVGRLSPYKGVDTFVAAARRASHRLEGVRFLVAGMPIPGYVAPEPEGLANGCRVDVVSRHLSVQEVVDLVAGCRFVVLPYTDASQSGVILTAYGLGKTVIATDVGGLGEYVDPGTTGLLVGPHQASELADAIVELCESPVTLASLEDGVRNYVASRLTWEHASDELVRLYGEVLRNRRQRSRR